MRPLDLLFYGDVRPSVLPWPLSGLQLGWKGPWRGMSSSCLGRPMGMCGIGGVAQLATWRACTPSMAIAHGQSAISPPTGDGQATSDAGSLPCRVLCNLGASCGNAP
eukprot:6080488-Alexandrium_andersonii.AAC.1